MMLPSGLAISLRSRRLSPKPKHHLAPILARAFKSFLATLLSVACVFTLSIDLPGLAASALPKEKNPKQDAVLKGLPITELSADEAILHALNRLAYGPRPGDIERVRQMGLAKWIDLQLNPKTLDDTAMEARLRDYPTLQMASAQLIADYPNPKQAANQAAKQAGNSKEDATEQTLKKDADAGVTAMLQDIRQLIQREKKPRRAAPWRRLPQILLRR